MVHDPISAATWLICDAAGREQLRVSRLAMDAIGSQADLSADPRFVEAKARKVYRGPVYFRKDTEPYMSIGIRAGGDTGPVTVAPNATLGVSTVDTAANLTQRPVLASLNNGGLVCNLRVATNESWKDRDGNRDLLAQPGWLQHGQSHLR